MIKTHPISALALAALVAMALAGCGGSGGSGGGGADSNSMTPPPPPPPPSNLPSLDSVLEDNPVVAGYVGDVIFDAGAAIPNAGSVTQSSNVGSDGVTIDQVEVVAEYGASQNRFSVTNGTNWLIGMGEGNPRLLDSEDGSIELSKRIDGGTLYVDVFSDIEAPTTITIGGSPVDVVVGDKALFTQTGTVTIGPGKSILGNLNGVPGTFSCASTGCAWGFQGGLPNAGEESTLFQVSGVIFTPSSTGMTTESPDTDYLAIGVWLFIPDDESSADDYVFGAFADGSDPFIQGNLMALTGTATYSGNESAGGRYSKKTEDGTAVGDFYGDVTLTAVFGSTSELGTISGDFTTVYVDDVPVLGTLKLEPADIGSANSGFFKGPVTGSIDSRNYSGNWAGQFFGNGESDGMPGSVAGTFSGSSEDDDSINYVGVFGAHKIR